MYTIKIEKNSLGFLSPLTTVAVERILGEYANVVISPHFGRPRELTKDKEPFKSTLYEVKNEGAILYQYYDFAHCKVDFIGFAPNSEVFNKLRSKLEEIANAENIESIEAKLPSPPSEDF